MTVQSPALFEEIDSITDSTLKHFYIESLQNFLTSKDLNKLLIKITSPNISSHTIDKPSWKALEISYNHMVFRCRLQSFPGCCGYLIISGLYSTGFPTCFGEPLIKSIFNVANCLHYQSVFSTHIELSRWTNLLRNLFDDTRETGTNQRTGNQLILFYKDVLTCVPAHIYPLPEQSS